jgi:hypothetical protein
MKPGKTAKAPKPQLNSNLLENKKSIKNYYVQLSDNEQESSLLDNAEKVMDKLIGTLGYVEDQSDQLLISFKKTIEMSSSEAWPKFKDFLIIVNTWINSNRILTVQEVNAQQSILQHLESSIKQYQDLSKATKDLEEKNLAKQVLDLLQSAKKQIKSVYKKKEQKFSHRTEPTAQEIKSIQEIFNFYAKQHVMIGKNPTFDMLGEVVGNIDSGSFLYFCKHFNICSNKKVEGERYLTKEDVIKIFKRCATLQKSMNLQGFTSALDELADLYFNEDYEKLVPFKCSTLEIAKKRIMLYEILRLDSPKYVNKTCMPLRTPFGPSHDKIIKPTIGKKLVMPNEEEVKEQIAKYKKEKQHKQIAANEEKGKEIQEKSKLADFKLREKKDIEDLKKRKDVFRMEDLEKAKFQDFNESKKLQELIQD